MAITGSTVEYPNVKLVQATKTNNPEEPLQIAFSVVDESGREEIVTAQCPTAGMLFSLITDAGWLERGTARPVTSMK